MKFALLALLVVIGCTQYRYYGSPPPPRKWDCDCNTTYKMEFTGNYQGKNQYMQNPYVNCTDSVERFATTGVTINDTIKLPFDSINSGAFEIPLKDFNFKSGDAIRIVVEHYGCGKPRMLNPEVY